MKRTLAAMVALLADRVAPAWRGPLRAGTMLA